MTNNGFEAKMKAIELVGLAVKNLASEPVCIARGFGLDVGGAVHFLQVAAEALGGVGPLSRQRVLELRLAALLRAMVRDMPVYEGAPLVCVSEYRDAVAYFEEHDLMHYVGVESARVAEAEAEVQPEVAEVQPEVEAELQVEAGVPVEAEVEVNAEAELQVQSDSVESVPGGEDGSTRGRLPADPMARAVEVARRQAIREAEKAAKLAERAAEREERKAAKLAEREAEKSAKLAEREARRAQLADAVKGDIHADQDAAPATATVQPAALVQSVPVPASDAVLNEGAVVLARAIEEPESEVAARLDADPVEVGEVEVGGSDVAAVPEVAAPEVAAVPEVVGDAIDAPPCVWRFNAPVKLLREHLETIAKLVDEVVITPKGGELHYCAVDPAHVGLIQGVIRGVEVVSDGPVRTLLDINNLSKWLKTASELDAKAVASFVITGGDGAGQLVLTATAAGMSREMKLDDAEKVSEPKVPVMALPIGVTVTTKVAKAALKEAKRVADFVHIRATASLDVTLEAGDEGNAITNVIASGANNEEGVGSKFSLDYLKGVVDTVKAKSFYYEFGADYPMIATWTTMGGGIVKFLLAPRIE